MTSTHTTVCTKRVGILFVKGGNSNDKITFAFGWIIAKKSHQDANALVPGGSENLKKIIFSHPNYL